jgi:acyl-CoA thioester hydrolase
LGHKTLNSLITEKEIIRVRFNESDPLGIVWHGHYLKYFEDGREAFGMKYGLTYLNMYQHGFITPIVHIHCNYKKSLSYGDVAELHTTFIDTPAAKIIFRYQIRILDTQELVAEGESVQVFLDKDSRQLQWVIPAFFSQWKEIYRGGA